MYHDVSFQGHRGMVQSARAVLHRLDEDDVLNKTLAEVPHFTVVVTGHSLGAGTAVILAFLLKVRRTETT